LRTVHIFGHAIGRSYCANCADCELEVLGKT
jgi:hypothetical protein